MKDEFADYVLTSYPAIKSDFPGEGRRKRLLRALSAFLTDATPPTSQPTGMTLEDITEDDDPFDSITNNGALGILLRTDFSDEAAWNIFALRVTGAEKELTDSLKSFHGSDDAQAPAGATNLDIHEGDGPSSEEDDIEPNFELIKIVNPATEDERELVKNLSNIACLRLFNDVDVRLIQRPPGQKPTVPHPLVDWRGWQEIYTGLDLWIYDTLSNEDQCARVVSQQGDLYGTATGDSWRARASHIPELQFNRSYLGMKIDFGGSDRWDSYERRRNLGESVLM